MKKTLLVIILVVGALALGVGGAFAVSRALPVFEQAAEDVPPDELAPAFPGDGWRGRGWLPPGQVKKDGWRPGDRMGEWMGPGRMNRDRSDFTQAERISIDEAAELAQEYAAAIADNLRVVEVMEFSQNFYAVVMETDSGRGAMELLVDPYTGRVKPEIGPNMMWNEKYGHMRAAPGEPAENTLSMSEAAAEGQKVLDDRLAGALLDEEGIAFYGYYSFDYTVDGEVAGMLSVNAASGQVWLHNWHGTFISEKEIEE